MPLLQIIDGRFNSLQTGKPIQRHNMMQSLPQDAEMVSIPFKRESLSKVQNKVGRTLTQSVAGVSIPFKRESLSKVSEKRTSFTN